MEDLSRISHALLVNIGTMGSGTKESMLKAGNLSNEHVSWISLPSELAGYFGNRNKKPVVFDPVGVGASAFRKETVTGTSLP